MSDVAKTLYKAIDLFEDAADNLRKAILSQDQALAPDAIHHIQAALTQQQHATSIATQILVQIASASASR